MRKVPYEGRLLTPVTSPITSQVKTRIVLRRLSTKPGRTLEEFSGLNSDKNGLGGLGRKKQKKRPQSGR